MATEIRPLRAADDRSTFRSGDPDLDGFFARYAGQNQFRHHTGTTYVLVDGDEILGYATIAGGALEGDALPARGRKALPKYPLPVLRLARLAVAQTGQSRGVGSALLRHVFRLALEMRDAFGCVGIVVDAKAGAVDYYAKVGFSTLDVREGQLEARPGPTAMFLPIDLVAAAVM